MPNELTDRRVAFLTAMEGVEQAELTSPWQAVLDAGGTPYRIYRLHQVSGSERLLYKPQGATGEPAA